MPRIDSLSVIGWALLLMPLLTMWHEVGGHASACVLLGGHVDTIGAFYVECGGLAGLRNVAVACAGVAVNAGLASAVWLAWRRARQAGARPAVLIPLWWVWVSESFVAAGYFLFSGVSAYGDLGVAGDGGLAALGWAPGWHWPARLAEIAIGAASYILLVRAAIRGLDTIVGQGPRTLQARRRIAHLYYLSAGAAAVLVGLLNPVGFVITLMSAAASSFGGLAGLISVGYAPGATDAPRAALLPRSPIVFAAGLVVVFAFAMCLGPSIRF